MNALKSTSDNLDQTARLITAIKKSVGSKNVTNAQKAIKNTILKSIGFTNLELDKKSQLYSVDYEKVEVKGNGQGTSNTHYSDATIYNQLRSYRTSIVSLNIKNHMLGEKNCPIESFKKKYSSKIEKFENSELNELLGEFDAKKELPELRIIKKKIRAALVDTVNKTHSQAILEALRRVKLETLAYYWINICISKVKANLTEKAAKKYDERAKNILQVNPDFVLSWANEILSSKNPERDDLILALMAATGRRTTEITKTAVFTKTGNDNSVLFDGQLKQKDRVAMGNGAGVYEIPTLVDSKLVIKGLSNLRKIMSNDEINFVDNSGVTIKAKLNDPKYLHDVRHTEGVTDTYTNRLSLRAKKLMKSTDMRPYWFRAAYTEIAYDMGLKFDGEGREAFRKRVLGHVDYSSQGNYAYFELSKDVETVSYKREQAKVDSKASNELVDLLNATKDQVFANTRAKGQHRLHSLALDLAEKGYLEKDQLNMSWGRAQLIDGKKIGAPTVKAWLEVLGI